MSLATPHYIFCKRTEPKREVDILAVTLLDAHIHDASAGQSEKGHYLCYLLSKLL